jgi:hypothetical protein
VSYDCVYIAQHLLLIAALLFLFGSSFFVWLLFIELLLSYVTIYSIFCNFFIIGSTDKPRPLFCGTPLLHYQLITFTSDVK